MQNQINQMCTLNLSFLTNLNLKDNFLTHQVLVLITLYIILSHNYSTNESNKIYLNGLVTIFTSNSKIKLETIKFKQSIKIEIKIFTFKK